MKEFKIAKAWAIFIYIGAPFIIVLFGWVLILPFLTGDFTPNISWVLIPVSLIMITIMVVGVLDARNGRLFIYTDQIVFKSTLVNRDLKFTEIKGFKVNEQYILIVPVNKQKKQIKISKHIGKYSELLSWLVQNFINIDLQNFRDEEDAILNDESLGWTKNEREQRLLNARKIAKMINWSAGLTTVWVFVYPSPYAISVLITLLIPIVAIVVSKFFDGLIKINAVNGSAYPTVTYAFVFPSIALLFRSVMDFNVFDYTAIWGLCALVTVALVVLILLKQKEFVLKKLDIFLFLFHW